MVAISADLKNRLLHAVQMFGTAADFARAIGTHRAQVFRWVNGERQLMDEHKLRILEAGKLRKMDLQQLAYAIDVQRCPCCDCIINDEIRALLGEEAPKAKGRK